MLVDEDFLDSWSLLEELTRSFEREHDCRVRLLPLGGAAGAQDKGKFLLAGGLQVDVLRIDVTEISAYLSEGALVDLQTAFEAQEGFDEDDYFPAALNACRNARGNLIGLPSTFTPYVMYVNESMLAELGLARPEAGWTWDDLLRLARAATADLDGDGRTDRYGISLTQWLQAVCPWIWQAGGSLLDATGTRGAMDQPEFVEAMTFLRRLLHEERVGSFDASFANQLSQGLFQAGRALFYGPVGYWETFRFKNIDSFEWDVLPLPRHRAAATSVAMTVYVVPRTSAHPELAARYVRMLAGERYQRKMAEIGNGVPGLVAAARSESFLKPNVAPESEHVFLDAMAGEARYMPTLANWRKIESLCQAELERILLFDEDEDGGDVDVSAACARMKAATDAYLMREARRASRPRLPRFALELAVGLSILTTLSAFLARRARKPASALFARQERHALTMLVPWAAGFLLFLLGPGVVALVLSFSEWSPLRGLEDVRFVGVENFARLAGDGTFHASLGATLLYAALSVPLGLLVALGLALMLRSESTAASAVRTACYIPAILSPVIVAAIWRQVLDSDEGVLNSIVGRFGLTGPEWLRDPDWVVPGFVVMSLWSIGAQMLVFLAACQALDPALDEAARIDGAGRWRRLWHVTLPQLGPVILFNAVTGTIAAFQVFAAPYVMTQGGPGDSSRFLALYLYESGFRHLDMGYAAALSWVLFGLLAILTAVLLATSKHWVHYAARRRG